MFPRRTPSSFADFLDGWVKEFFSRSRCPDQAIERTRNRFRLLPSEVGSREPVALA